MQETSGEILSLLTSLLWPVTGTGRFAQGGSTPEIRHETVIPPTAWRHGAAIPACPMAVRPAPCGTFRWALARAVRPADGSGKERQAGMMHDMPRFQTHGSQPSGTGRHHCGGNIVTGSGVVSGRARADDHRRPFNRNDGKVMRSRHAPVDGQAPVMPRSSGCPMVRIMVPWPNKQQ